MVVRRWKSSILNARSLVPSMGAMLLAAPLYESEASKVDLSIESQNLSEALLELGRQSGMQIAFNSRDVGGRTASSLQGQLEPEEALNILLADSGMTARIVAANAAVVQVAQASQAGSATQDATGPEEPGLRQAGRPEGLVEEVVVTGTFIRSGSFQPSSPVDTFTRDDFDLRAPTTTAEFLADLPYNVNAASLPGGRGADATPNAGSVNLRNLGEGATLVLLNSRRQTKLPRSAEMVDVNSLVPQIMIDRFEILKDGASALYGSDAVGGVVNVLTRDNFTGFEVRGQGNWITHSGKGEGRFGALWGGEWEDTNLVFGFEYNHRSIGFVEDTKPSDNFIFLSGPWQPAGYVVPRRDENGQLIAGASTAVTDVGCGTIVQSYVVGNRCLYDFWPDNSRIHGEKRYQGLLRGTHEFSPAIRLTTEIGWSQATVRVASSSSGSISVTPGITVPGHNPGIAAADADRLAAGLPSIFRAMTADGLPLYAVPSAPGATVPLRDINGAVVLTDNPTDPSSGIPFYEDVLLQGRIIGSQGGLPTNNSLRAGEYARSRLAESHQNMLRSAAILSGDFGDTWQWEAGFVHSSLQEETTGLRNNVLIRELRLALDGYGGANCSPLSPQAAPGQDGCEYFNPFTNSTFALPGSEEANTRELVEWLMPAIWDHYRTELTTFDGHISGELLDLPAGPVSVAAGVQRRQERWHADFDSQKNTGNIESGGSFEDSRAKQSANAAFVELVAPAFDNSRLGRLQINAALRYEDLRGGSSTLDPKLGFLFSTPTDQVQVRGSWGTSFLAPNLFQQFTHSTGLANISDQGPGGTGEATRRITTITRGNVDLTPQESESFSVGLRLNPKPGLIFDVTHWNYDFQELITLENVQALVNANDPNKVIRDETGAVIFVVPSYINLASLKTSGYDFEARYLFDLGRWGALDSTLMATYVDTLKVPTADGSTANVPNSRNSTVTGAPPSVNRRALARVQWSYLRHGASLSVRYTGSYENDSPLQPPGVVIPPGNDRVSSFASLDLSYTYRFDEGRFGIPRSSISVGALNVLESSLPRTADTVTLPFNDLRGRVAWLRLTANF